MRITRRTPEQQTLDHAISYLGALADQGVQHLTVRKAMELLGVEWREPRQPAEVPLPPGTDPITGCAPVTARPQTGPGRVQAAAERSRGGPAPVQPRGYA